MEIVADPVPMAVDEHGRVRIAGTRVTLDTVIACYQRGDTVEAIVYGFDTLSLADVHAVIAYYLRHKDEVDQYLAENQRKADEIRRAYEAQFGKQPTRAELEARWLQRQGKASLISHASLPTLPSPYAEALREAVDYILARYEVWGLFACGTIVAGTPDANSDLDMFVVHGKPERQRVQKRFNGVATEIFVNSPRTIRCYFADEVTRPSTAHMLANGLVVVDRHPIVEELVAEAHSWLATAPDLSVTQLTMRRYMAADAFENAQDIAQADPANSSLILHQAVQAMIDYHFLAANRPLPRAKRMLAALAELDPLVGDLVRRYYDAADNHTRLALAEEIAAQTIQARGFFEWETPLEEMPG